MRIAVITLASVLCIAAVSGCKSRATSCNQTDEDYAGAAEMPPLQAPPGLDAPNTRNALKVPPLNSPERKRGKNEPCLDLPPPFDSRKVLTPPPAEPQKPQ
jgi:uncharacterized lipoprotein